MVERTRRRKGLPEGRREPGEEDGKGKVIVALAGLVQLRQRPRTLLHVLLFVCLYYVEQKYRLINPDVVGSV